MTKSTIRETKKLFKELKEVEDYLHHTKMEIACMISNEILELGIYGAKEEAKLLNMSTYQRFHWTEGDVDAFYVDDLRDFVTILMNLRAKK